MSCGFCIMGIDFDADAFVAKTGIEGFMIKRKGEPRSAVSTKRLERSSVSIMASDADFSEFNKQVEETEAFLRNNKTALQHILTTEGIEYATIDFGVNNDTPNGMCKSVYFPPSLINLCAELGIAIELTMFKYD